MERMKRRLRVLQYPRSRYITRACNKPYYEWGLILSMLSGLQHYEPIVNANVLGYLIRLSGAVPRFPSLTEQPNKSF